MTENGPWFWGRAGCFVTPWTTDFDPPHASVTITPIWVRLLNFPMQHCGVKQNRECAGEYSGYWLGQDFERASYLFMNLHGSGPKCRVAKSNNPQLKFKILDSKYRLRKYNILLQIISKNRTFTRIVSHGSTPHKKEAKGKEEEMGQPKLGWGTKNRGWGGWNGLECRK